MEEPGMVWQEPAPGGWADRSVLAFSHLERNRMARQGRLPISPMTYLTEMRITAMSEGHATFTVPASPWFANSAGVIPGGMLAPVADAGLGASVGTELGPGVMFTTAELSLSFVSPIRPGPEASIAAAGQAIHVSRSVGISECFILAEPGGRLLAHGTTRCAIFPPIDPLPEPPAEMPVLEQPTPGAEPEHPLQRPPQGEVLPQSVFAERAGLEMINAWIDGELPASPIHHLTGLRPLSAEEGRVKWALPCTRWLSSPAGTVQGGFTAMLADAALSAAAFSTAPPGVAVASLDLKVNYLRPVFPDDRDLTAIASVVHRGRSLVVASAEILNADGKRAAIASGSSMYLPDRPADLSGVELPGGAPDD
jgi:uncharacterized protein (TIGR00369 family)